MAFKEEVITGGEQPKQEYYICGNYKDLILVCVTYKIYEGMLEERLKTKM